MRFCRTHVTWSCFYFNNECMFLDLMAFHISVYIGGALTSVFFFLSCVLNVLEKLCCCLHSIYYVLIAKEGTTHTKTHTGDGTDWVYIMGCTVLTMGEKGAKGQLNYGRIYTLTHTHACRHTHQLCTFNQYIFSRILSLFSWMAFIEEKGFFFF